MDREADDAHAPVDCDAKHKRENTLRDNMMNIYVYMLGEHTGDWLLVVSGVATREIPRLTTFDHRVCGCGGWLRFVIIIVWRSGLGFTKIHYVSLHFAYINGISITLVSPSGASSACDAFIVLCVRCCDALAVIVFIAVCPSVRSVFVIVIVLITGGGGFIYGWLAFVDVLYVVLVTVFFLFFGWFWCCGIFN